MARTPQRWDVEDDAFWESTGKSVANRNLWVSIPNLLCGFSVWLYWGMIAKILLRIHGGNPELFNFTFGNDGQPYGDNKAGYAALLLTLPAVAGLMGATLRIPNSFMIAICGGRNVKFMTTVLLILPALGAGFALQNADTSFEVLQEEMTAADKENRKPKQIVSNELRKLYDSLALDETLQPQDGAEPTSIPWIRIHNLPDHVHFDHRAHVAAGVTCQKCHGPVESMQRMEQFESLSMGWCVNCHRESTKTGIEGKAVDAKTDCAVCHY